MTGSFPRRGRDSFLPPRPDLLWGPAFSPMGTESTSPGGKRPGREADHSPLSSAEVKKTWSYTSSHPYVFMAWCLIKGYVFMAQDLFKHKYNFTFTFIWIRDHQV
jgi:hypothetical protein